jgi:hypothetical protein
MTPPKPKPPGFVGQREVLAKLSEFKSVDHLTLYHLLGAPLEKTMIVLRQCIRLGWARCERTPGLGRGGRPGIYSITKEGRQRLERRSRTLTATEKARVGKVIA